MSSCCLLAMRYCIRGALESCDDWYFRISLASLQLLQRLAIPPRDSRELGDGHDGKILFGVLRGYSWKNGFICLRIPDMATLFTSSLRTLNTHWAVRDLEKNMKAHILCTLASVVY